MQIITWLLIVPNFKHFCALFISLCFPDSLHFDYPPFFLPTPFDILIILKIVVIRIEAQLTEKLLLLIKLLYSAIFRVHCSIRLHVLSRVARLAMIIAKGGSLVNHCLWSIPFLTFWKLHAQQGLWHSLHRLVRLVQLKALQVLIIWPRVSRKFAWLKLSHLASRVGR